MCSSDLGTRFTMKTTCAYARSSIPYFLPSNVFIHISKRERERRPTRSRSISACSFLSQLCFYHFFFYDRNFIRLFHWKGEKKLYTPILNFIIEFLLNKKYHLNMLFFVFGDRQDSLMNFSSLILPVNEVCFHFFFFIYFRFVWILKQPSSHSFFVFASFLFPIVVIQKRNKKCIEKKSRETERRKEIENFAFLNYFFLLYWCECTSDKTRGTQVGIWIEWLYLI